MDAGNGNRKRGRTMKINEMNKQKNWFIVQAVEYGPNGRKLAICKPNTAIRAITEAVKYDTGGHGYKCIQVMRQPDEVIIWQSTGE